MSVDLNKIGPSDPPSKPVAAPPITSEKGKADAVASDRFRKGEAEVKEAPTSVYKSCFKKTITEIQRRGETIRDPLRIRTAMQESGTYAAEEEAKTADASPSPPKKVQKLEPFKGGRHPITKLVLDTYIPAYGMRRLYDIVLLKELAQLLLYTKMLQENLAELPISDDAGRIVCLECNYILIQLERWIKVAPVTQQKINEKLCIYYISMYKNLTQRLDSIASLSITSNLIKAQVQQLAMPNVISNISTFYSKEQLLQELRLISIYLSGDNLVVLQAKIKEISKLPGVYVPHQLIESLSETLLEGSKWIQVKSRIQQLPQYSSLKATKKVDLSADYCTYMESTFADMLSHVPRKQVERTYGKSLPATLKVYFQTGEVIRKINELAESSSKETAKRLQQAIVIIHASKLFIDRDTLLTALPSDISWAPGAKGTDKMLFFKGLTEFTSLGEAASAVKLKQETLPSEFAFKRGLENQGELLMGSLVMALGPMFSRCVIPKLPVKILGVEFDNAVNPEGIVSRWVADIVPFPKDKWTEYNNAKKTLFLVTSFNKKIFDLEQERRLISERLEKNKDISIKADDLKNRGYLLVSMLAAQNDCSNLDRIGKNISQLKIMLERAPKMEAIRQEMQHAAAALFDPEKRDQESLMALGVLDALFCASDAIEEQLLRSSLDGTVRTVDQAKYFKGLVKSENEDLFFTLRSFAIGHPYAEEPMPPTLVEAIVNLDYDKIEQEWRELDLVETVLEGSTPQAKPVKQNLIPKVSNKNLADFKERFFILKRYIEQQQKERKPILLREAVEAMYAQFLPFIKAVDLIFGEPFENISTVRVGKLCSKRSLDSIVREAESTCAVKYPEFFDISFLNELRRTLAAISNEFYLKSLS